MQKGDETVRFGHPQGFRCRNRFLVVSDRSGTYCTSSPCGLGRTWTGTDCSSRRLLGGFDVTDSTALRFDVDRHRDDFRGEPVLTQEIEGRLGPSPPPIWLTSARQRCNRMQPDRHNRSLRQRQPVSFSSLRRPSQAPQDDRLDGPSRRMWRQRDDDIVFLAAPEERARPETMANTRRAPPQREHSARIDSPTRGRTPRRPGRCLLSPRQL